MNIEAIKKEILCIVNDYPIEKVLLFGSRASSTNRVDSDVDFIMEFYEPVSLLTLSEIKIKLEDVLKISVDIIHGPLQKDDMIEVNEVVELYAA